ncbi:MAG: flagellar hook-length control protein FliK [Pseudolabrys sp.]|nr:flagellar hook-length control protein FliK [Pseudolabrys sp.]MDP2296763.1 flagellar hook-length control protein FliK [Pseudolabrys sp.]
MSSVSLSPSTNTAAGASLAQLLQLKPGDVINALVLSLIKDTTFRLQLPSGTLDVHTDKALVPGTRVELAVKGTVAEPELLLTPLPDVKSSRSGNVAQPGTQISARMETQPRPAQASPERIGQIAATIVRDAATRQGGIAQLYADLEASLAQPKLSMSMPPPVVVPAKQLFALRLDATASAGIDADDIKLALAQSGVVSNPGASRDLSRPPVPLDARAVLLSLREALKNWESAERALPPSTGTPSSSAAPAAPTLATSRPAGPMLPYPNGPTVPQPSANPALPANATARELALHLLDKTDSAIAREMILKIASLPDRADFNTRPADANSSRMTFDIPMATPNGTAVAQLRIERDGAQRDGDVIEPVWRANFSIDLEPIGAVHVRIALVGGKATVTLNAERTESAESLLAGLPLLEAGLRRAELEPGVLTCQAGQPAAASADHGLYVDHAS